MPARAPGWGWHRLDQAWADRLVGEAAIRPGELVVDVGAGFGALTGPLVDAGAQVVAFELHPLRAEALRRRFAGRAVTVVEADASDLRLPRRPYRIVASPPYGVTTSLLRRVLQPGTRLIAADLILQAQAAQRWAGGDAPGRNRWGASFDVRIGEAVPRRAFRPPPRVNSRVLRIRRR